MRLVPMEFNHLPSVARLCGQLGYAATETELAERLGVLGPHPDHQLLVGLDDEGNVVGWGHGKVDLRLLTGRRLEISALVVDEACRGRGIGAALLGALEIWGRSRGCPHVRVSSQASRTKAHRFYGRSGYDLEKISHLFRKPL